MGKFQNGAPKSALGKAFTYLKEQWPYLTNYLKDGRLELSNNRAERSIKPFVIDRKNFLFANTPKGAKGSAIMFSLIQTAIENGLDPYKYLTWLLRLRLRKYKSCCPGTHWQDAEQSSLGHFQNTRRSRI